MALSVTLLLATAVRLHYLDAARLNSEHQYQSAMIARQHFLEASDSIPEWRKEVVAASLRRQLVLELPVVPILASFGYRMLGRETLTLPRLMTMLTWLIGGAGVFFLAKRLASTDAAWIATTYFLFVPSGVHLSVSFLPDAPMVMLMILGLVAIFLFFERPSPSGFVVAGVISAAAILTKPVCIFPIAGGIAGLAFHGRHSGNWIKRLTMGAALLVLATSSGSVYYLLRMLRRDEMATQLDVSFVPSLLLQRAYWEGWLESVSWAVGFVPLVAGLLGVAAMRAGSGRSFLIGLWGGYVVFCLFFTYHVTFAGHYHLLLIPIAAVSFAPLVMSIVVRAMSGSWFSRALCAVVVLLVIATTLRATRDTFVGPGIEPPDVAAAVGDIVQHSTRTVLLSPYYGAPLEYHGELAGEWWPRPRPESPLGVGAERSVSERFTALGFKPEYFIITDFLALRAYEQDLEAFLTQRCTLLAEASQYRIYRLQDCL